MKADKYRYYWKQKTTDYFLSNLELNVILVCAVIWTTKLKKETEFYCSSTLNAENLSLISGYYKIHKGDKFRFINV